MTRSTEVDFLIVGNHCHDTLVLPTGRFERLGGASAYISAVISAQTERYAVASNVGQDFKYHDQMSCPPRVATGWPTTHFIDDLTGTDRVSHLIAVCAPILADEIPATPAKIGLISGVAMEVLPETLQRVRELCEIVICDVQSLIRIKDSGGKVVHRNLHETPFRELAGEIDFLKASREEFEFLNIDALRKQTRGALITEGAGGCRLIDASTETLIPTHPVADVDSSGAGDCFMAGFAYGLSQGMSVHDAILEGHRTSAIAVQVVGIPNFRLA